MEERLLSLPQALSSAACARRTVGELLRSLGADEEEVTPVVTVVSELVVNGVTHAASDVDVVVRAEDDVVRVEVVDYGGGVPAIPAQSVEADRGRGLRIVDALADRWGVHREDAWKAVWAELHVSLPERSPEGNAVTGGGRVPVDRACAAMDAVSTQH